jgi:hypothetical protein
LTDEIIPCVLLAINEWPTVTDRRSDDSLRLTLKGDPVGASKVASTAFAAADVMLAQRDLRSRKRENPMWSIWSAPNSWRCQEKHRNGGYAPNFSRGGSGRPRGGSATRPALAMVSRRPGLRRFAPGLEHKAPLNLARHPVHQADPASARIALQRIGDRLHGTRAGVHRRSARPMRGASPSLRR